MKKYAALILTVLMLAGCGNTSQVDKIKEEREKAENGEVTLSPADEAVAAEAEKAVSAEQDKLTETVTSYQPQQLETPDEESLKNGDIDLDLTSLNPNMLYAEVFQITGDPDKYQDMKIRAKGTFNYMMDDGTEYFAVFMADAAACCQQGLEFRTAADLTYPDDYPAIGAPIVVTGTFNSYKEGVFTYCELVDAVVEVQSE
jgi:outer membrane murein-binding lipoprotein Lpp